MQQQQIPTSTMNSQVERRLPTVQAGKGVEADMHGISHESLLHPLGDQRVKRLVQS